MSEIVNRPSRYEIFHWKIFNSFSRVVAWGFLVVGSIGALFGLITLLNPNATIQVNGEPTTDFGIKAIGFIFPLVFAILGILLLKATPYHSRRVREWMKHDEQEEKRKT